MLPYSRPGAFGADWTPALGSFLVLQDWPGRSLWRLWGMTLLVRRRKWHDEPDDRPGWESLGIDSIFRNNSATPYRCVTVKLWPLGVTNGISEVEKVIRGIKFCWQLGKSEI